MTFHIVSPEADSAEVLARVLTTPNQTAADRDRQVRWFMEYARRLGRDLSRNWMALRHERVVAACHCMVCPGRTAMLFVTDGRVAGSDSAALSDLAARAVAALDPGQTRLIQVLLHPDDLPGRQALLSAGFAELARLLYMERRIDAEPVDLPDLGPDAAWVNYDAPNHGAFAQFIERTYEGSLDCPGLSGRRHIDDILDGHKGAGLFRPHRWRMLLRGGEPAACILMGENPLRSVLEVVYMAVAPSRRGRGEGRRVLADGLRLAWREGFTGLTLAVDSANHPAVALYRHAGFDVTLERVAMIRPIHPSAC